MPVVSWFFHGSAVLAMYALFKSVLPATVTPPPISERSATTAPNSLDTLGKKIFGRSVPLHSSATRRELHKPVSPAVLRQQRRVHYRQRRQRVDPTRMRVTAGSILLAQLHPGERRPSTKISSNVTRLELLLVVTRNPVKSKSIFKFPSHKH